MEEQDRLRAFKSILESTASFYKQQDDLIKLRFEEAESAYCSKNMEIILPPSLLEEFYQNKLPRFCIFYHELGHALYSEQSFKLLDKWKKCTANIPASIPKSSFGLPIYDSKYLMLDNWIEDFRIEYKLKSNYSYLKDILKCIRLIPVKYNMLDIDKAFHYYYTHEKPTPTLNKADQQLFTYYINNLMALKNAKDFGTHVLTNIITTHITTDSQYIKTLVEFYNWCVSRNIFSNQVVQPPLRTPVHINVPQGQGQQQQGQQGQGQNSNSGSSSDHSHLVGRVIVKQIFPDVDVKDPILNEYLETENTMIDRFITNYILDAHPKNSNFEGLFTTDYIDTAILAKPNIKSFFNPNRIADRVLFLYPNKTYNNVSIYRDISGSTRGSTHKKINDVCKYLIENIPIDLHFYLYSSGNVSIHEAEFIDWKDHNYMPKVYRDDPIIKQMGGGTNSDAIADVISQQMSDKWLNIIITDGDLHALMARDNIESLLNNVAIISVGSDVCQDKSINRNHYVCVGLNDTEYSKVSDMLNNFKGD